jgi:2'-5' RNA ligase
MMPSDISESLLAIPIPAHLRAAFDEGRRLFDPQYETWRPHITLAYPPFIPKQQWSQFRRVVVDCLAGFQPFELTLRELDRFTGAEHVLWLKPEDNGVISRMRTALENRLPQHVPSLPYDYIPHVTVGQFAHLDELSRAGQILASSLKPFSCRIDTIYYVVRHDGGDWYLYDQIALVE